MSAEQRRHPRRKTLKSGKIIFHKGLRNQACVVRDLSSTGAKLQINQPFKCPEQFLLQLLNESARPCELTWEIGDMVGTRFTQSVAELDAPPRVQRWKAAWESRDANQIVSLYVADCRHHSPRIALLMPEFVETGLTTLDQIRMYAVKSIQQLPALLITILSLTADQERSVIEYELRTAPDAKEFEHVVEIIEWTGDKIREARVFTAS